MPRSEPRSVTGDVHLPHRTIFAAVLILVAIPAVIAVGIVVWEDRKYYLTSLLILVLAMLPFILKFEKRKPQARELVLLAVMTAFGVAGRVAFYMLPQFKPVLALVIITGVAFGGEAGFITGAMTGFVSNFFFGQGPWTPWQMFSFGIIGFLAGLLFGTGRWNPNRILLCVFGGLSAVVIYGPIMDTASLFMFGSAVTWQGLLTMLASGFIFNVIHGAATVVFLAVLSQTLLEKLERIKKKYGLLEA